MVKIRTYVANKLVALARKIDPPNTATLDFFNDRLIELMVTGQSYIRVSKVDQKDVIIPVEKDEDIPRHR